MERDTVLSELGKPRDEEFQVTQDRLGINTIDSLGVSVTDIRQLARNIETDHELAKELWDTGIHEARILATMIDDPSLVTEQQMEKWISDVNSWDLCDQVCTNLFRHTHLANSKSTSWLNREDEFVKRAGYVLIANFAVHDDDRTIQEFEEYLRLISASLDDGLDYYAKTGTNWALREIGKRNDELHHKARNTGEELQTSKSPDLAWIGRDVLKELAKHDW